MCDPQHLTTLQTSTACYGDSFTFHLPFLVTASLDSTENRPPLIPVWANLALSRVFCSIMSHFSAFLSTTRKTPHRLRTEEIEGKRLRLTCTPLSLLRFIDTCCAACITHRCKGNRRVCRCAERYDNPLAHR
jgi:hypothetical protein